MCLSNRSLLRSVLLIAFLAAALQGPVAEGRELRIMTWQGYADDDWIDEFEKAFDVDVQVVFAATDDEIWAKMRGSEGRDFDLFAVNTAQLQRYIDAGLAAPIDLNNIPNREGQLPIFRDPKQIRGLSRDGYLYGIPFAFDALGLIYDRNKVSPPPTSLDVLWDPKYKGKILAYDYGEHSISAVALLLNMRDPFHLSDEQMAEVKAKLIDLKRQVLSFYSTADEATQLYRSNDIALIWAQYGQQQVKAMQSVGANIAYINPREGALAWVDVWSISSATREKLLAEQWINFLLEKRVGEQLTVRTGYGSTTSPTEIARPNDRLIYIEPVENPTKRSDIWNEIRAAE